MELNCPQTSLLLLRFCLSACKFVYASRTIPPELVTPVLSTASHFLRNGLSLLVGTSLSDGQWHLARIPISLGGLGLTDPVLMGPCAFVSSASSFLSNAAVIGWTPLTSPTLPTGLSRAFFCCTHCWALPRIFFFAFAFSVLPICIFSPAPWIYAPSS